MNSWSGTPPGQVSTGIPGDSAPDRAGTHQVRHHAPTPTVSAAAPRIAQGAKRSPGPIGSTLDGTSGVTIEITGRMKPSPPTTMRTPPMLRQSIGSSDFRSRPTRPRSRAMTSGTNADRAIARILYRLDMTIVVATSEHPRQRGNAAEYSTGDQEEQQHDRQQPRRYRTTRPCSNDHAEHEHRYDEKDDHQSRKDAGGW